MTLLILFFHIWNVSATVWIGNVTLIIITDKTTWFVLQL